jgi:hypothetical protein
MLMRELQELTPTMMKKMTRKTMRMLKRRMGKSKKVCPPSLIVPSASSHPHQQLTHISRAAPQPAKKKRKTGPVSAKEIPADEDEVEVEEPQEDGVEDEDDSADEDDAVATGPASKAKQVKGKVVPADDDLEEVDEVVAADEEDDDE